MIEESTDRQQRRRQRRKEEIVDAAMEMITELGIGGFSVNRLADAVDLTPGALYRYFDSREMILAAVELRALEEFDAFFSGIEQQVARDPALARIVALALGYAALETLRPERFRLLSHFISGYDAHLSDEVASQLFEPTMQMMGRIAIQLHAAEAEGALRPGTDGLTRVALLWSSLHGVMERRKLTRFAPEVFDPTTLARHLVATLLVGWGAEASAVEAALTRFADFSFYERTFQDLS